MVSGWRYRGLSVLGAIGLTGVALYLANHPLTQSILFESGIAYISRLHPTFLSNGYLTIAWITTLVIMTGAMWPVFKPEPRRILDTFYLVEKRLLIALLALAAIGYFDYSFRLPRPTLITTGVLLFGLLPAWFIWIRQQSPKTDRAILVGNDPEAMMEIWENIDHELLGYVSPSLNGEFLASRTDGGKAIVTQSNQQNAYEFLDRLGGLTRLEEIIKKNDVETVYLVFEDSNQTEFFSALDICDKHGAAAKVHRDHVDTVLTESGGKGEIVDVVLEPLDLQDYLLKRIFDFGFAFVGLVALSPLIVVIMIAVKLDDGRPIFYKQERTAEFGKSFSVYKFRSMKTEGETPEPVSDDKNDRITRVGRFIRQTHLDEIPQLVSILTGKMSVVGPRAVWRDEEMILQSETDAWQQRWFVKPGLTGLAQIRDISSEKPEEKLRSDLEYIRRQSFWFDLQIVIRQFWKVIADVGDVMTDSEAENN